MQKRLISYALMAAASTASPAIIQDVRESLARDDLPGAEARLQAYRKQNGDTPESLEALSWLSRGALAAKAYDAAESYARQAYDLSVRQLHGRALDSDRYLPVAVGAAIEVSANVLAARGERSAAVDYLRAELRKFQNTSIRARIQKNLNLLTLEGKPAPALDTRQYVGPKPLTWAELKGKPVLLFFWAHWCGDCKSNVTALARIEKEYGKRIAIVGPTQRYGYVEQGNEAPAAAELKYIAQVREQYYAARIPGFQTPVSEENFKNYGASTTPTVVLIDSRGIVRLYHPGKMSYEELKPYLDKLAGLRRVQ